MTARELYQQAYDHRERTILIARASLGGTLNERIVKNSLPAILTQAHDALAISRAYRNSQVPLPWRRAAEEVRRNAVLICGKCRCAEKAADGTIIFEPNYKSVGYNLAILNSYDRMLEALTSLRDLEPVR